MSQQDNNSKIKDVLDATTGLVKAIPIYEDTVQPAAKEIGKSLETIAKTVNVALAPISALVWGYEQIKEFVSTEVSNKLRNIKPENITTPNPTVAGPALEALKYTGHEEILRQMYANLLATSLNSETTSDAHPSYVEVIRQLTPDEAKLLHSLSEIEDYPIVCHHMSSGNLRSRPYFSSSAIVSNQSSARKIFAETYKDSFNNGSAYSHLDNILRLRLLEIEQKSSQQLKRDFLSLTSLDDDGGSMSVHITFEETIKFTEYGKQFIETCVREKSQ